LTNLNLFDIILLNNDNGENMKLLTKEIEKKLKKNYDNQNDQDVVLKLFNPIGQQTWLITQIEPNNEIMWGLADIGMGFCEYGTISLSEIKSLKSPFGLSIERDSHFSGGKVKDFQRYYETHNSLNGC
jgi:hypothetical protein